MRRIIEDEKDRYFLDLSTGLIKSGKFVVG